MVSYRLVAIAGLFAGAFAVPLNINLGAYSPALVVGDGEISFGGRQDVASLMNALEGAAVNAAGAAQAAAPAVAAPAVAAPAAIVAPVVAASAGTAAGGQTSVASAADPNLQEQAATITTLQGMGKEIAPREAAVTDGPVVKRDLAGFDRALKYAEAALTKGPVVQLGTGEGGAGVGIIVDNRPAAAAAAGGAAEGAAAGVAAGARAKRQEGATQPRRRTKVTTMFVRRGVPAVMQSSSNVAVRQVNPIAMPAVMAKRDETSEGKRDTIDAINLNVEDPQGITMTFVETSEEGDDE